jgi:hypothetical protein
MPNIKIFLNDFWKHLSDRRRKKFVAKAEPIIRAFIEEYGEPKRPVDVQSSKFETKDIT